MKDLNIMALTGRLAGDPEVRGTRNGDSWVTFRVACNRGGVKQSDGTWKDGDVDFIDGKAFKWLAERIAACRKGDKLLLHGRLNIDNWTAQDGQKRSRAVIVVEAAEKIAQIDTRKKTLPQGASPEEYDDEVEF